MFVVAELDPEAVEALTAFETEKGVRVVALTEADTPTPELMTAEDLGLEAAALDDAVLDELKALEQRLGVCLLAVR